MASACSSVRFLHSLLCSSGALRQQSNARGVLAYLGEFAQNEQQLALDVKHRDVQVVLGVGAKEHVIAHLAQPQRAHLAKARQQAPEVLFSLWHEKGLFLGRLFVRLGQLPALGVGHLEQVVQSRQVTGHPVGVLWALASAGTFVRVQT